jgi:outer membrane lipoprotein-sorting protein
MATFQNDEAERRLQQLHDLTPPAERTAMAIQRAEQSLQQQAPFVAQYSSRWKNPARIIAAVVVLFVLAIGLAAMLVPGRDSAAFADVQKRVEATKSIHLKGTTKEGGVEQAMEMWITTDGRVRMEDEERVMVVDTAKARMVSWSSKKKESLQVDSYHSPIPQNLYQVFRDLRKDSIRKLPAELLSGKRTEVFAARLGSDSAAVEWKVWVDPQSQLPVRLELTSPDGKHRTIISSVAFDGPIDEALFKLESPEGFKVTKIEGGKPSPASNDLLKLQAKPTVGLGPVTFGMSKDDVIKLLGQPDKIDQRGMSLDYLSRGYTILVHPVRGVMFINCISQKLFIVKVRDFAGETAEGIRLGSSLEDVKKAYGDPSATEDNMGTLYIRYNKLGLEFVVALDRVMQITLSPIRQ